MITRSPERLQGTTGFCRTQMEKLLSYNLASKMNDGFKSFKENPKSHNYQIYYENQHGNVYLIIITSSVKEK